MKLRFIFSFIALSFLTCQLYGAPKEYLKKPEAWFRSNEARQIAENILSYQSELGGWPKNKDTTKQKYSGDPSKLEPTFDNGATTDELRYLAFIYNATNDDHYKNAFNRGLDYVLVGQYANGGWPQFHPPGNKYHRYITFNDNAMVRLMSFVRDVATDSSFEFVDKSRRTSCSDAFARGIDCILKCQIRKDGKLTVWCAQHDEVSFEPQSARAFEIASFSGSESVGIVRLLMSIDNPTIQIVESVDSAVQWLTQARITGIRVVEVPDSAAPKKKNLVVQPDPKAEPVWARFYDLKTQQPLFTDRDGVPRSKLEEIGYERRNNYTWYGNWPQKLIDVEYPKWKAKLARANSN